MSYPARGRALVLDHDAEFLELRLAELAFVAPPNQFFLEENQKEASTRQSQSEDSNSIGKENYPLYQTCRSFRPECAGETCG